MNAEIVCPRCSTPNLATRNFCKDCGAELNAAPTQPAPSPTSASQLFNQRYREIGHLGSGGFGAVFKVEDTKLANRVLAVKKLQPSTPLTPKEYQNAIDAFQREAEMLAGLKHRNLPQIYDCFEENNSYYLVMEFIAGKTLEKHIQGLKSLTMPEEQAIQIGIQIATVLDYLHTRKEKIIFRDIKPANIMIVPGGDIYLIDFGIARHFKPGQKKDTTALGSPGYAAPEQYGKDQTSPQSDIYSLGALLHQMLTGDDPSDSPFMFAPLTGKPPILQQLLTSMLERDPQNRPASAAIVKQQLQQILQDLQSSAGATGGQPKPAAKSAPPTRVLPRQPVQRPCGELVHSCAHHREAIYALAWSPDGKMLASTGGDKQVCVWEALTGKVVFIYQKHTANVHALAWSPNSKYVASAGNDRTVQVWQAKDGQAFTVYQEHRRWVQALSWSLDARLIASGDASGQIHLWNPRTRQCEASYRQHRASIYALSFSPDGSLVASGDEAGAIHVWESISLSLYATHTNHQEEISALAWSPDGKCIASSSEDRKDHALHIWQATTGTQVATYAPHERMINALAWSPDGQYLASASRDQTVRILDPQTGNSLFTYRGHTSSVNALAWSPDGNYLASASEDGQVQVWWAK
jgi:eukaryotic-like serine/threonine-protein kinase